MVTEAEGRRMRAQFVEEARIRLIGPSSPDEVLPEKPQRRYLSGMLFPRGASTARQRADEAVAEDDTGLPADADDEIETPADLLFQRLPAALGLTFAVQEEEERLEVSVGGACYASAGGRDRWQRSSIPPDGSDQKVVIRLDGGLIDPLPVLNGRATLRVLARRSRGARIVTISLVNECEAGQDGRAQTPDILFQVRMRCTPSRGVPAYPDSGVASDDPESEELSLQYRQRPAFAVGHGCAADWPVPSDNSVPWIGIEFLPAVEVPPVTTDIPDLPDIATGALSMVRLQDERFDPLPGISALIDTYAAWRDRIGAQAVPERYADPRERILRRIDAAIARMRDGLALLASEPAAMAIFRLANRAMLIGVARSRANELRTAGERWSDPDVAQLPPDEFRWRPFQLAFFVLSLRGLWDPAHPDRETADLIWFPTGGGKTEAYLAVSAFEMIRRRMVDGAAGEGTAIIKRYTLRLLTIQQFERAGSLICALESMRRDGLLPGQTPFSLGLWVGGDSSPNSDADAVKAYQKIVQTVGRVEGTPVPLKQCPACGTPIVPAPKPQGNLGLGMRVREGRLSLFCTGPGCRFGDGLPVSYVDDRLDEDPPTMLLGTVDKFAMLAWREEARAFFGLGPVKAHPPSLVIQDELHLISGPLGTLAGIYEAAIDTAISRLGPPAKFICATATIRRADDQIRRLYGREGALFPPAGLDAGDSFFSTSLNSRPGRLYVGAMGQGHTPTFANVITSAALLAAGARVREAAGDTAADTWWTLVAYHNSKRELGKTLSLARDDIPARLRALGETRRVEGRRVRELSANIPDSEIPEALYALKVELPDRDTADFVACTNMLSVGVDIRRLGLMMVNGQPKTVSEYIQASSRVGRDPARPPGLVLALFSPTKPRDRSHYEFFSAFHGGYYRHVEPTSVTPFAPPARQRGLHGAFIALVRMVSPVHANRNASAILAHEAAIRELADAMLARIRQTGDGDADEVEGALREFIDEWRSVAAARGSNLRFQSDGRQNAGLIRAFHQPGTGRETLQSLRHVDPPLQLTVPMQQLGAQA